jgi:uncharacterized membrane protein YedE/YeeE
VKKKRYLKPWIFGVVTGGIFVLAEVVLGIYPPSAYAFCMSCHVRDLLNTGMNEIFRTHYQVTAVAERALLLTSPGVLLGAFIAARSNRETRALRADRPLVSALLGFVVMTIGILIFGCPTRIVLRAGYGEVYGIAALLGMLAGIAVASWAMKLRWRGRGSIA